MFVTDNHISPVDMTLWDSHLHAFIGLHLTDNVFDENRGFVCVYRISLWKSKLCLYLQ